jgi:periplasmic divalent cation tolerance protein
MKTEKGHRVVFITAANKAEAEKISEAILNKRLAACVNILEGVHSLFWWQGKIDNALETLLMVKTNQMVFNELVKVVKANHSYKVPEIIALPIIDGNDEYLRWIDDSVA